MSDQDHVTGTDLRQQRSHRGRRTALFTSIGIAVVLTLFVTVLATRKPAATRLARSPLLQRLAPALDGTTVGGQPYSLDDRQGEFVVVNFFATWCVPCIEEHDDLVRFAAAHKEDGDASVVSVVYNDDLASVRRFFRRRGGSWPVLRDGDGSTGIAWGGGACTRVLPRSSQRLGRRQDHRRRHL